MTRDSWEAAPANTIAGAPEFDQMKQAVKVFTASRLFIYYNERVMEGTVKSDSGAQIRDGIKSVGSIGACPETDRVVQHHEIRGKTASTGVQGCAAGQSATIPARAAGA